MIARAAGGLVLAVVALVSATVPARAASALPELPRVSVDTTYVPPTGRSLAVRAGGDVQAALNAAQPGDVIVLEAGATFTGSITLPAKTGVGWIVVRTSAPDRLPPPGTRVDPSYASVLPKLVARAGSVITTAPGAHHYRFVGVEIRPRDGVFLYNLVQLGSQERSVEGLPHHIVFDRCYLHGDPNRGTRRGIAMNSRVTAVVDSYLADFKDVGADSQAIASWNGPGPYKIVNNYLEGAGENLIFGGADPSISEMVPSDIEIRNNRLAKPLAWRIGDRAYQGNPWTIKNLFELKNARRVVVEGNLFEQNWAHAQSGFAVLFTVRNQDGHAPWSVVEDVTFINNVVRGTTAGINILGSDDNHPSQQTKRILIKNNLFLDVGGPRWGGGGTLFQILNGTVKIVIDHNTAFQTGNIIAAEGQAHTDFVFTNNIVAHNAYGIVGTGTGPGTPTLARYFPGAVVTGNVILGGPAALYPAGNAFPSSLDAVGFVDRGSVRYRSTASSAHRRQGVGVDFDALSSAMAADARRAVEGEVRDLTSRLTPRREHP